MGNSIVLVFEMGDTAQAEKKIRTLSEKVGASEDGILWIKELLDPFSDTPRRFVGIPDIITGNSIIQVVKLSKTVKIGSDPQDMHIFMDNLETKLFLSENEWFGGANSSFANALNVTAISGVTQMECRGGINIRQGVVGADLNISDGVNYITLPTQYCANGATRVVSKAMEIHNVSNKLNVGGAITVYRDTGAIPYARTEGITCFAPTSNTVSITHTARNLSKVPINLAAVTRIPGSQTWNAEDGAYIVATLASQTNSPMEEDVGLVFDTQSSDPPVGTFANIATSGGLATNACAYG